MTEVTATPLQRVTQTMNGLSGMMPRRENVWATRYVWFPLHDIHHADVSALTGGGHINRLKWQPVTRAPRWAHVGAIPEAEVVARRPALPDRAREEMYWIKPARIIDSLATLYAERGLVDSVTLASIELEDFAKFHVDEVFFPETEGDLPATQTEVEARIDQQLSRLQDRQTVTPSGTLIPLATELIPYLIDIGTEMLAGVKRTAGWLRQHIDERHAEMEKAKNDATGRYRGAYDRKDLAALAWLGLARRDEALNTMAVQHSQLPAIIKQLAKMNAQQMQQQGGQFDVQALGEAIGKSLAANLNLAFGQPQSSVAAPTRPRSKNE